MAWNSVKNITLKRSWRKLWPGVMKEQQPVIENQDSELPIPEITNTINELPESNPFKSLSANEIVEWVNEDEDEPIEQVISDEDIIKAVQEPQGKQEEDSLSEDENAEANDSCPTWKQAADAIDTIIRFAERNSGYNSMEIINLHIFQSQFASKRAKSVKQGSIKDFFQKQ